MGDYEAGACRYRQALQELDGTHVRERILRYSGLDLICGDNLARMPLDQAMHRLRNLMDIVECDPVLSARLTIQGYKLNGLRSNLRQEIDDGKPNGSASGLAHIAVIQQVFGSDEPDEGGTRVFGKWPLPNVLGPGPQVQMSYYDSPFYLFAQRDLACLEKDITKLYKCLPFLLRGMVTMLVASGQQAVNCVMLCWAGGVGTINCSCHEDHLGVYHLEVIREGDPASLGGTVRHGDSLEILSSYGFRASDAQEVGEAIRITRTCLMKHLTLEKYEFHLTYLPKKFRAVAHSGNEIIASTYFRDPHILVELYDHCPRTKAAVDDADDASTGIEEILIDCQSCQDEDEIISNWCVW